MMFNQDDQIGSPTKMGQIGHELGEMSQLLENLEKVIFGLSDRITAICSTEPVEEKVLNESPRISVLLASEIHKRNEHIKILTAKLIAINARIEL